MKNFDNEWEHRRSTEARTFQVLGESFVLRAAVKPETFDQIGDIDPAEESVIATFAQIDEQILSMIEPGDDDEAVNRWRALRERPDGLGVRDLQDILAWMVEQHTGRPPTSLPASSDGPSPTGTRSTAASSSRALQAV